MKKKKRLKILGVIVLIVIVLAVVALYLLQSSGHKFKSEFEKYNGESTGTNAVYQVLDIDENTKVKYLKDKDFVKTVNNETAIILVGSPTSSATRMILPALLDAVKCSCLENFLYLDATNLRDEYSIQDGKAVKTREGSKYYQDILKILSKHLDEYEVYNEEGTYQTGEKRLEVPSIIVVKNGKVLKVDTYMPQLMHTQSFTDTFNNKQYLDLKEHYTTVIEDLQKETTVCSDHC